MKRAFVWTTACLFVLGAAVGCDDPPTPGADSDVEEDTAETDDTGPQDTISDAMDTDEPDDGGDIGDDAGDTDPDDSGPMDAGDTEDIDDDTAGDTLADSADPTDTRDGSSGDTGDTALDRDALPSQFGSGSVIDELYVDKKNPSTPRCCFDFDGDGTNDNALAEFLSNVQRLGSTNQELNNQISNGNLTFLFEYLMWSTSNWANDPSITMYAHPGEETAQGDYEISPKSYKPNGQPKSRFKNTSTSSEVLNADKGKLKLPFSISLLGGVNFSIRIFQPKLEADVDTSATVGPGGEVPLNKTKSGYAKLGGITPKADVYSGVNQAAKNCTCMQGNKLLTDPNNDDIYQCNPPSNLNNCTSQCRFVLGSCSSVIQPEVQNAADVDRNQNGNDDALTVGASFTAAGAKIIGVAP